MMKTIIILILFLSLQASAQTKNCVSCSTGKKTAALTQDKILIDLKTISKKDFKKRPIKIKGYYQAINIESNFTLPITGKDTYWGDVFFNDNNPKNISYRDEEIAERKYKAEKQALVEGKSYPYFSEYKISDINSPNGAILVKGGGAEVVAKSNGNFSTKSGGKLTLRVKAPKGNPLSLTMDIVRSGAKISRSVSVNNQKVAFDTIKINAKKGITGSPSILSGLDSIQFYSNGKLVHTIHQ